MKLQKEPIAAHVEWNEEAAKLLKVELVKRNMTYSQLAEKLNALGISESANSIKQKIFRGTFQFSFFLQCAVSLDLNILKLDELLEHVKNLTSEATR